MAETTKQTTKKKVTVRLPRNPGQNARQEEFFSVNGKNYLIKRGETVEIPAKFLPQTPSANVADWIFPAEYLQIDVSAKTVTALKASESITLRVNVLGANGSEPAEFDVYILPKASTDSTDSTDAQTADLTDAQ